MELNGVAKGKFGYLQQSVKLGQGQQTTMVVQGECNDVYVCVASSQKIC